MTGDDGTDDATDAAEDTARADDAPSHGADDPHHTDDDHDDPAHTPGRTRVLVDAMCGKLATYLRMCGYDAAYALDSGVEADDALASLAREEGRVLVTRDRALARRVEPAVLLTDREIDGQLRELAAAGFALSLPADPVRCGACNGSLARVAPDDPVPDGAPDPAETAVWRCRDCGQHFWTGSHWDDVRRRLDAL